MEGFRHYYEKSLRVEKNIDWREHSLDYGLFKKRLLFFRQRRSRIKSYLRNSPNETIPESTLAAILGPKVQRPPHVGGEGKTHSNAFAMYVPFVEDDDYSSSSSRPPPPHDLSQIVREVQHNLAAANLKGGGAEVRAARAAKGVAL